MQQIEPPSTDPQRFTALERAQAISRSLAEAARRARFSSRARGAFQKSPFESRRGAKTMRLLRLFLFGLLVALPNAVALVYFGVVASDQFESEAMFTVSSGALPKMDGLGSVTGLPPMAIVQDTMIVTNFIESRAMVERLERELKLRDIYSSESIDWWSRFKKDKPIEKFTEYWSKKAKTSISFPGGIVRLTVRAFSAADAKRISEAVIAQCEALVNGLNNRMRTDTVLAAERDLERAAEKLKAARLQLEQARNVEGMIDVRQQGASLYALLTDLKSELLKARSDYETKARYVSEQAPQMRPLKSEIASLEEEIAKLNAQITESEEKSASALAQKSLSGRMPKFEDLELEEKIAEKRYDFSASAVTAARMLTERKMIYLHQIVAPALPQDPRYPKRWINIGMTFVASWIAWAIVVGLLYFVRNNMA